LYAIFIIYSRYRGKEKIDIYYSIFWTYVFSTLFILPFNWVYGSFTVSMDSIKWIILLAFISTNIAFLVYQKGIEYIEAPKASVVGLIETVFVIMNGFLLFNEELTTYTIIGAILICSSVILTQVKR